MTAARTRLARWMRADTFTLADRLMLAGCIGEAVYLLLRYVPAAPVPVAVIAASLMAGLAFAVSLGLTGSRLVAGKGQR